MGLVCHEFWGIPHVFSYMRQFLIKINRKPQKVTFQTKQDLIKYPQLYGFIARGLAQQELKLN